MAHLAKELVKPALLMLTLNWILGIGIIECPIGKPHPTISILYVTTILTLYCSLSVYIYPNLSIISQEFKINIDVVQTLFYMTTILTVCAVVMGWFQSKGIRFMMKQMNIAYLLMGNLGIQLDYTKLCLKQAGKVIGIFTIVIIFPATNLFVIFYEKSLWNNQVIITMIVWNYPFLVLFVIDTTFMNIISYVRENLKKINRTLKKLLTTTPLYPQHIKIVQHYKNQNINFNGSFEGETMENRIITNKLHIIREAKEAHLTLVKICKEADNTFGLHNLLSVVVSIFVMTVLLYHIYDIVINRKLPNAISYKVLLTEGTWLLYYFCRLFLLSRCCSNITQEAIVTGDIISECYDEPYIDRETKKEIRDFNLQMIHNVLTFNAHGFFIIDFSLIGSVIASITTYLMILIQLENYMHKKKIG